VQRAQTRCGERARELREAHGWLVDIAQRLDGQAPQEGGVPPTGAEVRQQVEAVLDELALALEAGRVPAWLQAQTTHLITVLRRLGFGLYHCYDVPGLPRTDNDLEQFYRRLKSSERRTTGRKRADSFVVRVGGFAVFAIAARPLPRADLERQLAGVPAAAWQRERAVLRSNQVRQAKMRRFHLHRAAYLAELEVRWTLLSEPP
jgi:hypothetical protein